LTLTVSKSVAPRARWGSWNYPMKWGPATADRNGGRPFPVWLQATDELRWLWPQFGAFMLDLYPEMYVGAASARPAWVKPDCGAHNHSENVLYFSSNMRAAKQLRARYAPKAHIYGYLWPVEICGTLFQIERRCMAQLRPGSSFPLSALQFL